MQTNPDWFDGLAEDHKQYEQLSPKEVKAELAHLAHEGHQRPEKGKHLFAEYVD